MLTAFPIDNLIIRQEAMEQQVVRNLATLNDDLKSVLHIVETSAASNQRVLQELNGEGYNLFKYFKVFTVADVCGR